MLDNEPQHQTDNEAMLLINCLRGQPFVEAKNVNWQSLLELTQTHRVLPLVRHLLIERNIEIPDFFDAAARECESNAEKIAAELKSLLHQFAEQGIDVLPLKGPVLAEKLYGNVTLRPCDDLDLLVRRQDFERSGTLLFDMGFVAGTEADDYQRKFFRDGVLVELHFNVTSPRSFPFDLDGLWSRTHRGRFRDEPMHTMSDSDLVLFVCLHGLKHWFCRLIWIQDLANALNTMKCEPAELIQTARQQGLEQALLIGCEVVRETFPQQLPQGMEAVIAESPKAAEQARRAVVQLFAERPETDNAPEIWRFYLQTEWDVRQKWRRRLSFLTPTIGDYEWAERHRIYRGLAPLLRPLRLLKKYGLSRAWRILFPPPI